MDRVLLFSLNNDRVKVTIEAFFDQSGNLVVEGYDIGKATEEFWGDSDYEYSTTIAPAEVLKMYELLQIESGNKELLLKHLQQRYNTNSCYSEFSAWLEKNSIKSEGFSWR